MEEGLLPVSVYPCLLYTSTDLFSEMNMVDSASPFIDCIYLFNENGEWAVSYTHLEDADAYEEIEFVEAEEE